MLRPGGILEVSTISSDQQDIVLKTFHSLGTEFLRPVFDALDGKISYEDLKISRLYYLSINREGESGRYVRR